MRHYEIVFLIHPDQSEQVTAMVDRYRSMIEADGGKIHRFEDWGVRKLAYPIDQTYKAHYALLNIECTQKVLTEILDAFRFNDAVIRNMIIRRDQEITQASAIMEEQKKEKQTKSGQTKSEQTKSEQTKSEQPKSEQPKSEQPKSEQPKSEQPKSEQPNLSPNSPSPNKPSLNKPSPNSPSPNKQF